LIERHILATQLDFERSSHIGRAEPPDGLPGGSVAAVCARALKCAEGVATFESNKQSSALESDG
jgi:hypothetical protein